MNIKNILFILFAFLFFQINIFSQESFTAKVVGVVDGDTITVFTKDKRQLMIRFAGTDAPELEQSFGVTAKEQLSGLIFDKDVTITDLKKDCADRLSASISFQNKNLNLLLVEAGNAWADKTCQPDEMLSKTQSSAREKKIGLWQNENPQPPWEFRENALAKKVQKVNVTGRNVLEGQVMGIADRATIIIKTFSESRIPICIRGLEIPEPSQPKADVAVRHLRDLLIEKTVRAIVAGFPEDENCKTADVYLNDVNINLQMVRDGVAWSNKNYYYPEGYYVYRAAEQAAIKERRGIWEDPLDSIVPPWEYRERYYPSVENDDPFIRYGGGSSTDSGNKTVRIRAYTRADGTYVPSRTRSTPRSGGSKSSKRKRN